MDVWIGFCVVAAGREWLDGWGPANLLGSYQFVAQTCASDEHHVPNYPVFTVATISCSPGSPKKPIPPAESAPQQNQAYRLRAAGATTETLETV